MEAKLKINSCSILESDKAILEVSLFGIEPNSYITIEGSDPSPVFIIEDSTNKNVAYNILCNSNNINFKLETTVVNNGCSVPVFATVKNNDDVIMLADVYVPPSSDDGDSGLYIFPSFVGRDDKVSIYCHANPGESVDFLIANKKFSIPANAEGHAKINLPVSSILPVEVFNGKAMTKFLVSAKKINGETLNSYMHVVPKNMYALAAVEDVNRPSCVIMDPASSPVFSLSADSYPQKCFSEPLIAYALSSKGEEVADLEAYSDNWKSCDNAYATRMEELVSSDCRINENYNVVKLNRPINIIDETLGASTISGEWAAVWSACDPNPSASSTVFDPCNISGDVLSKIPRVFMAIGKSAVSVDVIRTARIAIKKSPAYYHSAFLLNAASGKVASIIVRLANGDQISKSVNASEDVRSTLNSLRSELLSDQNFINSSISVTLNGIGENSRLDFGSDDRFVVKSGSISYQSSENCLRTTLNSNYVVEGEITYPEDVISDASNATHVLMLDGPFRGVVFPFSANGSAISIDACPRINTIGSFRVDQDYSCMHVALLGGLSRAAVDPDVFKLPFLIGEDGNVIPASSPSVSADGSIVCSGVDGDNTYIYYHNGKSDANPWTRVTQKPFDFPQIRTDSYLGDDCIVCETPVGEETQLHACYIGANTAPRVHSHLASMWNKLSMSENWSQYVGVGNLDEYSAISSLTGATLVDRDSVVNLSAGAYRTQQAIVIYESLRPASLASSDAFFASSFETTPGSGFSPYNHASFVKGQQIASILIHLDPSASGTFTINLGINGRIAKILASGTDLARTDASLGMQTVRGVSSSGKGIYPPGGSSNVTSLTTTVSENSNSIVISATVNGTGVRRMRVIVVPDSSLEKSPDDWVRMASGDSLVSVPSSDSVVMEFTPDGSECAAIARIYKDEEGNYFDGKFDQMNLGVDCYVDLTDIYGLFSESNVVDRNINNFSTSLGPHEFEPSVFINNVANNSFILNNIHYSVEYIGPALSSKTPINFSSSEYRRSDGSPIWTPETLALGSLPGLEIGEKCAVISIDLKVNDQEPAGIVNNLFFSAPIVHVDLKTISANYVANSDVEYAASIPANLAARRNAQTVCTNMQNKIGITISTDRKSLLMQVGERVPAVSNYSMRVYLLSQDSSVLSPKSQNDVQKEINKIIRNYGVDAADPSLRTIGSNKMRFSQSGLKYDACIPLVSSCRFDDINENIYADIPNDQNQTGQLNLVSSDEEYAAVPDYVSFAGADVYEQSLPFRFGSRKSNLNPWGVSLLLEKETAIFTNAETPTQYSTRTGSFNNYIESKVYEVFTGRAKLAIVADPRYSNALDGSYGVSKTIISEGDPFLVDGGFRLSISSCANKLPLEYLDISKRRDKIISDPSDPLYETAKFSSLVLCAVDGVPNVAANIVHDMPGKGRQIDVCFGNPYGEHPRHDVNTQSPVSFRSGRRYRLDFSSIYIGSPKVQFNSNQLRISDVDFAANSMFVPSPVSNMYIQNRSFESSFADPGDFTFLENDNGYIDNWDIVGGGVCYAGAYVPSLNGSRNIILESNISSSYLNNPQSSIYANYTFTKNRRSRYSTGVGGGIKTSISMPSRPCILDFSYGMRRYSSTVPARFRSIQLSAGDNAITYRALSRNGSFDAGDSLDYKRGKLEFIGTGSSMDFYIHNLDTDTHKYASFSHCNYYGDGSYTGNYDSHVSSFFYFVNSDGNLFKLYTDSVLMNNWAGNPQKAQTPVLISSNVVKVSSKGSAYVDGSGSHAFIAYLKKDGSLGHLLENGTISYTLPSGNDFVDVAAGIKFGVALRRDGTLEAWGDDTDGVVSGVPSGKFSSIDCGAHFACALGDDGSIYCWGDNGVGQCSNPSGIFVKVRCGWDSAVAIDRDGYAQCWGENPNSGPWSVPATKLRDAHVGGGPVVRIYPSSISATGGTSFPAGGSPLHDYTVIHSDTISRFAVGITVDGSIVTWGDDSTLLVDDTQDATALDDLLLYKEYSAIPDANYVFVSCGPQGACAITDDGQIFGFGSGQVPFQADGAARHLSYFKNENCIHRGGPSVDSVSAAPSYMIYEEDENPPRWAQLGFSSENEWSLSNGVVEGRDSSSLPITFIGDGINRSASLDEKNGRIHIAFESTRDNQNSICYSSSYPESHRFCHSFRLTDGAFDRNKPSIAVDEKDRKMVAWRERRNSQEFISCAVCDTSDSPDPDICFVDSCVLALRKNQSSDPYYLHSVQECSITEDIGFSSAASNVYFNVEFYSDQAMLAEDRVAIYSSLDIPDNFSVSGEPITSAGISVLPNQSYRVVFYAPNDSAILGSPLWYKISAISSGSEYGSSSVMTDFLILKSTGTLLDGFNDCTTGCLDQEGEVYVVYEGVQRYDFDIDPIDVASFNAAANVSSIDSGLFMPTNYNKFPGIKSRVRTMSYIVHLSNNASSYSSHKEYAAKITFSSPIAAIVFDGDQLEATDGIAQSNAFYPSASLRGMYFSPGSKVIISPDGATVQINFVAKQATGAEIATQQLRIFTIETESLKSEKTGVFGCDKVRNRPCGIQFTFNNDVGSADIVFGTVHFRATVYSSIDSTINDAIAMFTSVTHPHMWSYGDETFSSSGLFMYKNDSAGIGFYPDMIEASSAMSSFDTSDSATRTLSSGSLYYDRIRESLLFDIAYRVKIDAIVTLDASYGGATTHKNGIVERTLFCSSSSEKVQTVDSWKCSASTGSDFVLSNSNISGSPNVTSGRQTFYVAFERYSDPDADLRMPDCPDICMVAWDSEEKRFDASGQGGKDRIINLGYTTGDVVASKYRNPKVIIDDLSNFSIFGVMQNDDGSSLGKCDGSVGYQRVPNIISNIEDLRPCSFSDSLGERFATGEDPPSYMKIRVDSEDIFAFKPNPPGSPYPIVTSPFINLDIIGAPGVYAVRVRNENDADFSPWIPIGGDVPVLPLSVSDSNDYRAFQSLFRARYVSRDRFVMPWMLSAGEGHKTVCVEALTFFGKTVEFCTQIICQPSSPSYSINFFAKSGANYIKLPYYKDYPVASKFAFAEDKPQISDNDLRSINESTRLDVDYIKIEVVFDNYSLIDKIVQLSTLSFFSKRLGGKNAITASVVYRGIEVNYINLSQDATEKNKFIGEFSIKKSDGILRKDGITMIKVDIPLLGIEQDYIDFLYQIQELKGQTVNISNISFRPYSSALIPPIDDDVISRAFGNSEYYS